MVREARPELLLGQRVPQRVQQQVLPPAQLLGPLEVEPQVRQPVLRLVQRRARRLARLQALGMAQPLLAVLPVQLRVRPLLAEAEMALAQVERRRLRAAQTPAAAQLRRHPPALPARLHPPDLVPMAMAARHPRPKARKRQRLPRVDAMAWIVYSVPWSRPSHGARS